VLVLVLGLLGCLSGNRIFATSQNRCFPSARCHTKRCNGATGCGMEKSSLRVGLHSLSPLGSALSDTCVSRKDAVSDVAATANVPTEDVYFQEIDIGTADPNKSIFIDVYVDGKHTEGALASLASLPAAFQSVPLTAVDSKWQPS
jgi:hypothetical protein